MRGVIDPNPECIDDVFLVEACDNVTVSSDCAQFSTEPSMGACSLSLDFREISLGSSDESR